MKSRSSDRLFFPNLNGLRFTGALMVFIFHCFSLDRSIWGDFSEGSLFRTIQKVALKGHHGVGLFFVLSGFLITSLLLNEIRRNGTISVKNFFFRRALRIWPLYFLIVFFGFVLFPLLPYGQTTLHDPVMYSAFLSNMDELTSYGVLDQLNFLTITWSVSIEEQFYLVLMILLLLFPFFKNGKALPYWFLSLVVTTIIYRFLHADNERELYFHTFANVSDLAIGGLTAYLIEPWQLIKRIKTLKRPLIVALYILGTGMLIASNHIFKGSLAALEHLFTGIFFAFVILEQVYSEHSFFKADKIPGFFKGGELTYGFYMFHCIFLFYLSSVLNSKGWTNSGFIFTGYILLAFAFTYLTSSLSMRYFEGPLLRLKEKFRK